MTTRQSDFKPLARNFCLCGPVVSGAAGADHRADVFLQRASRCSFRRPASHCDGTHNLLGNPIWIEAGTNSLVLAALSSTSALVAERLPPTFWCAVVLSESA